MIDPAPSKNGGGAGYRSLCLLHAKQALYHLSYTPKMYTFKVSSRVPKPGPSKPNELLSHVTRQNKTTHLTKHKTRWKNTNTNAHTHTRHRIKRKRKRQIVRQPGVEPGAKAWEASMLPIHHWRLDVGNQQKDMSWRSRVSIPVPADCEPTALPSELHPRSLPLTDLSQCSMHAQGVT